MKQKISYTEVYRKVIVHGDTKKSRVADHTQRIIQKNISPSLEILNREHHWKMSTVNIRYVVEKRRNSGGANSHKNENKVTTMITLCKGW